MLVRVDAGRQAGAPDGDNSRQEDEECGASAEYLRPLHHSLDILLLRDLALDELLVTYGYDDEHRKEYHEHVTRTELECHVAHEYLENDSERNSGDCGPYRSLCGCPLPEQTHTEYEHDTRIDES